MIVTPTVFDRCVGPGTEPWRAAAPPWRRPFVFVDWLAELDSNGCASALHPTDLQRQLIDLAAN
jgi:predicted N-acyltransferase